jgi:pimeloyl-ACP methyl ester carboxylesterase
MPTIDCDGLTLHYADTGTGEPVVFLNGLGGDSLYWMGQLRACGRHDYRCLALDNRDSGRSAASAGAYTLGDLADDVATLLRALEVPPAHMVGHSLGGMIAQEMALRHPERVRSLLLVCTLARSDAWFLGQLDLLAALRRQATNTSAFFETLLPWLVSYRFFEDPDHVERLKVLIRQNPHPQPAAGFQRQIDAMRGLDTLDRLSQLRCPVLAASGADDVLIPARYGRQIAETVPGGRFVLVPGVGHSPPLEDGRRFNELLLDFLHTAASG